ncbi:DUF3006 domain-containing protein [Clostridia bacterium OttesenSCG-928-O13]|nr:DUF3006 domain-containing protein [Clostridia bacterium OttesenSCG-928-O13]
MFFSVDRIVSGKAMLIGEDKRPLEVSVDLLPPGTKEGDMLFYGKDGFSPAPDKTAERRTRVAGMLGTLLQMEDDAEDDPTD